MSAGMTAVYAAPAETYAGSEDPLLFKRVRTWWTLLALFLMADGEGMFTTQAKRWTLKLL